jgi:hypothetical protein
VQDGAAANQFAPVLVRMAYDAASYGTEQIALRISQREPRVGATPWIATAIIDDISVAIDGTWVPVNAYADWTSAKGLDGTPGKESGIADDPDHDGVTNLSEFAFGGDPLAGTAGVVQAWSLQDTDADSQDELVLTLAVRSGASFGAGPSPSAVVDGVTYTVQGSLDLNSFSAPVDGPIESAVLPPSLSPVPPSGYQYVSFRLAGSEGLTGKGFLRATATPSP